MAAQHDDLGGPDHHQHVPSNAASLVLSQLQGRFAAVGYRNPDDGQLFWDLNYFFDELAKAGDKTSPFKLIQALQTLCDHEELLSVKDLHFRRKNMRLCKAKSFQKLSVVLK